MEVKPGVSQSWTGSWEQSEEAYPNCSFSWSIWCQRIWCQKRESKRDAQRTWLKPSSHSICSYSVLFSVLSAHRNRTALWRWISLCLISKALVKVGQWNRGKCAPGLPGQNQEMTFSYFPTMSQIIVFSPFLPPYFTIIFLSPRKYKECLYKDVI